MIHFHSLFLIHEASIISTLPSQHPSQPWPRFPRHQFTRDSCDICLISTFIWQLFKIPRILSTLSLFPQTQRGWRKLISCIKMQDDRRSKVKPIYQEKKKKGSSQCSEKSVSFENFKIDLPPCFFMAFHYARVLNYKQQGRGKDLIFVFPRWAVKCFTKEPLQEVSPLGFLQGSVRTSPCGVRQAGRKGPCPPEVFFIEFWENKQDLTFRASPIWLIQSNSCGGEGRERWCPLHSPTTKVTLPLSHCCAHGSIFFSPSCPPPPPPKKHPFHLLWVWGPLLSVADTVAPAFSWGSWKHYEPTEPPVLPAFAQPQRRNPTHSSFTA